MGGAGHDATFGPAEMLVFVLALVAGTACSLTSKILLEMRSVGMTGEDEAFVRPLAQTFGMFLGMVSALFMHAAVKYFRIPFPGYSHAPRGGYEALVSGGGAEGAKSPSLSLYFLLLIPSIFDLAATALCMYGLPHVDVSIYQMLRGGAIVFVALLKQVALGDRLRTYMWIGVFWNVVSILLVGCVAALNGSGKDGEEPSVLADGAEKRPVLGVVLILTGAFVQSLQYAFEEKVMTMDNSAPPLLLIGMEGFWGSLVCLFVLYPVVYSMPGSDHGSYENPWNTLALIRNSRELQGMCLLYFFSVFFYNMLAVLVTYMLNSVYHAILDNFRPMTVWGTDLFIFYCITRSFGEPWTAWSYLQLLGMGVLIMGTLQYNGDSRLSGRAVDCFIRCDYDDDGGAAPATPGSAVDAKYRSPYISPLVRTDLRKAERGSEPGMTPPSYGAVNGRARGSSFAQV